MRKIFGDNCFDALIAKDDAFFALAKRRFFASVDLSKLRQID